MAIPVIMPKQGQSVETCIITRWFRQKGEHVNTGDILFSYETDKASFDLESPADGIILEIFRSEGEEVPVLENVAVIGNPGESAESFRPGTQTPAESRAEEKPEAYKTGPATGKSFVHPVHEQDHTKVRISPRARRLASEKRLTISGITGTGPNGRIIFSDIERAIAGDTMKESVQVTDLQEYTEQPLSNVRKLISKAMHSSLQNSAQLTHHMSADARRILEYRKKIKEDLSAGVKRTDITLNDIICRCVIKALGKFPEANSHFLDDRIRTFNRVHLGLAVDTSRGLIVPAVRDADLMDLDTLSARLKAAAEACKSGNIDPELIKSSAASFTVSNLGNYGVEMFTPVINLPQVAILGVCTIISRPADTGNGIIGFVPFIGLSLTYDHRAIDGGPATLFLREIKNQIENFTI
ncbi:MAG: 2-oxo acid dehydrogenase subunit E2 [Bacteroidales bacterium]|nr:2-oxo acid dehydrogenase subunit E2 [Bacteroidales bacterium]